MLIGVVVDKYTSGNLFHAPLYKKVFLRYRNSFIKIRQFYIVGIIAFERKILSLALLLMNKKGAIVIIEDDSDDRFLLEEVFTSLDYPNKRIYFQDGQDALDYLNKMDSIPFLILSDINMPRLDGFQLRQKLHTDAKLQLKCIPYLFFSTAMNQKMVIDAYSMSAQGFFIKQNSFSELEKTIRAIMEYWTRCAAPNNFDN